MEVPGGSDCWGGGGTGLTPGVQVGAMEPQCPQGSLVGGGLPRMGSELALVPITSGVHRGAAGRMGGQPAHGKL